MEQSYIPARNFVIPVRMFTNAFGRRGGRSPVPEFELKQLTAKNLRYVHSTFIPRSTNEKPQISNLAGCIRIRPR